MADKRRSLQEALASVEANIEKLLDLNMLKLGSAYGDLEVLSVYADIEERAVILDVMPAKPAVFPVGAKVSVPRLDLTDTVIEVAWRVDHESPQYGLATSGWWFQHEELDVLYSEDY